MLGIEWLFNKNKSKKTKIGANVRAYDGAKTNNADILWTKTETTEDQDIYNSLGILRARSRDLAQNNPIMKHYLLMLESNVVGKDGFALQVFGRDEKNRLDYEGNQAVSTAWKEWTKKENCDVYGKSNFRQLCAIMSKSYGKDGEVLVRLVRGKTSKRDKFGFKLQLLDTTRLDINLNKSLEDGFIKMGVECDLFGCPRAYHLIKKQTNNSELYCNVVAQEHERVNAEDIIHYFNQENPEQTRGVPLAHSVMTYMRELNEFNQACLLAAKVGAASSIYLEREKGAKTSGFADGQDEDGNYFTTMGIGEIRSLPAGMTMKSFEGHFPSDAYEVYTKRLLQLIAAGLGLSQVFLGNDTEDLNYSTARTVILEERNYYMTLQSALIDNVLMRVYEVFLEQSLLNKQIKINKNFGVISVDKLEKFSECAFIGRRWEGIDQQKEENAKTEAFSNFRKPLSVILAENGQDLSEVAKKYKQDDEIIRSILGDDYSLFKLMKERSTIDVKEEEEVSKEEEVAV